MRCCIERGHDGGWRGRQDPRSDVSLDRFTGAPPFAILLALFSSVHGLAAKLNWAKSQDSGGGRRRIPLAPSVAAALIGTFVLRSLQRNHPVSTTVAAFS